MNLLAHLLIVSAFDLTFRGECRFVYVNRNLTFVAAWTRCHDIYKGQLADLERLSYFSQRLRPPCGKTDDFFWHGSLMKTLPWISFEGCFRYFDYFKAITMPYISLAWCQSHCLLYHPNLSHFAVDSNLCLCDIYSPYGQSESKHCSIPCDDKAICGGNGFISLYKRARLSTHHVSDFDSPENIDKQCLAFKCGSGTNVTNEAANCVDQLPYICVNRTGQFNSPRKEPWLTSNILCTNMLEAPVCRSVTMSGELRRWTKIFRVQYQFKDHVSTTVEEVANFLNSSFYTKDREGRRVLMPDGRKEYPSLCETDISDEKLIDEDWICDITSGTDIRQLSSSESSMETTSNVINKITTYVHTSSAESTIETTAILGASIVVLIIIVGLLTVYRRVKNTRQERDMNIIEMQIRAPTAGGIFSGPTIADSISAFSNVNASYVERISSCNNLPFASITNGDETNVRVADNPVQHSKPRNNDLMDKSSIDIDTEYLEVEDACTGEIVRETLTAINCMDDGGYTEIGPGKTESEIGNCEQSVYSEIPEKVYETLNTDDVDNVYEKL